MPVDNSIARQLSVWYREESREEAGDESSIKTMDLWFEWEENNDERFSFEDSDRFEEDSLGSWISEPESISANWRGWKRNSQIGSTGSYENEDKVDSLIELCAKKVAKCIPFETVEHTYPQTSEQIQLRIAFWSFPQVEDDIRLYSCLANGSPDEFQKGEHLVKAKAVRDVLQIGKTDKYFFKIITKISDGVNLIRITLLL